MFMKLLIVIFCQLPDMVYALCTFDSLRSTSVKALNFHMTNSGSPLSETIMICCGLTFKRAVTEIFTGETKPQKVIRCVLSWDVLYRVQLHRKIEQVIVCVLKIKLQKIVSSKNFP